MQGRERVQIFLEESLPTNSIVLRDDQHTADGHL